MAKESPYKCAECGVQYPKWVGRCTRCNTYGSVTENTNMKAKAVGVKGNMESTTVSKPARKIKDISYSKHQHSSTGIGELDRVLGGGLVSGQVVLLAGEPGVGKALALDTLLPTSQGWTTMEKVTVNDFILSPNGHYTKVIAVSPVYKNLDCYRVTFENGETVDCSGEHLWNVQMSNNLTVLKTIDMVNDIQDGAGIYNYAVPSSQIVCFEECNSKGHAIPEKEKEWGNGYTIGYELVYNDRRKSVSEQSLLSLSEEELLLLTRSSCNFRAGVLEGIREAQEDNWNVAQNLDSLVFFFTNQKLAQTIYEIMNSLGYKPVIMRETWNEYVEDCKEIAIDTVFTVRTSIDMRFSNLRIISIEQIESVPVKCIQVDSEDNLYLVGSAYIPTHNSTMLLTAAHEYGRKGHTVLYISGEESAEQISLRARRVGADSNNLYVADETDLGVILGQIEEVQPDFVVVDSVQTVASADIDGRAGGMAQVQEVATILTRVAKASHIPLFIVGQINKANDLAGPKTLEHLVDTVLFFEGDRNSGLRLLRTVKNRFGPADEIACFEQTENGIEEVSDPSGLFSTERDTNIPGTATTVVMEGRRPLLAEIQALVSPTNAPNPRRGVSGLDFPRTAMLIAVTERYGRLKLYDKDTFLATVAGMKIAEPAADLAICLALASAVKELTVPTGVLAIGEVALSGEIRHVQNMRQRLVEASRLGYNKALVPKGTPKVDGMVNLPVNHIREALEVLRSS